MRLSDTENTIIDAMARAFYVSAWAQREEDRGRSFSGQELMDVAPKTPRFARDFALIYAGKFSESGNGSLLIALNNAAWADVLKEKYKQSVNIGFRFQNPELEAEAEALKTEEYAHDFGHYVAMQAMGHGVSWFDDHAKFDLAVPHTEAYL